MGRGRIQQLLDSWFRSSIARRISLVTAATTLAIVLTLGALSYWSTQGLIEQQIRNRLSSEAAAITERVTDWLDGIADGAVAISSNMMVVNALVDSPGRDTYIVPFLRTNALVKQGIVLTLCDFRGVPIASSVQGTSPVPARTADVVSRVVGRGEIVAEMRADQGRLRLFAALPLIYPATDLPEGMLVLAADLSGWLEGITHAAQALPDLSLRLRAGDRMLWEHRHDEAGGSFLLVQRLQLKPPFDRLDLTLEVSQASRAAYLPLRRMTIVYVLLGAAIVLLTVALALYYGRRIARPLEELTDAAETVAKTGSPTVRLPIQGTDEIASLASSFNTMLVRLQGSAESLEQRVAERTQELAVANDSLRRSEEFVSNILNTVDEGFIVVDRQYRIVAANRAFREQAGKAAQEILGKPCYEVSHHRDRPCYEAGEECAVRKVFESGQPMASSHVHREEGGTDIHVETKAFPIRNESGEIVSAIEVLNNITERKSLEEQLRQAQKMEAVGLLAGGVAHDFNNVLSAIIGYGSLLKLKVPSEGQPGEYIDEIMAAADRATNLTRSLLTFSRKQDADRRPEDLGAVVRGFAKLLQRMLREDIELRLALADENLVILADRGQIEQIIMNLATNARDAMSGGGTLTFEARAVSLNEEFVHTHGFGSPGDHARLSVVDTGEGMDDRTRQRIFEPFFTTKELGRGTGLGLAVVYGAVRQNGGHITVHSEPGGGTRFDLYFPLYRDAVPAGTEDRQPAEVQGGREVILLAEDESVLRRLTAQVLRDHGYSVIEAEDGEDALRRFAEHRDTIQLAVLDVIMPKRSGGDVAQEFLRARPDLKVLFMSGYSKDIVSGKGLLTSEHEVLSKPFAPSALLAMIREVLDRN
jgi:PAS domain S-box-containing protein